MRLFLAALILMVGTMPAAAQWLDRHTAWHSAHPRRQAEPHRTRAARTRWQA